MFVELCFFWLVVLTCKYQTQLCIPRLAVKPLTINIQTTNYYSKYGIIKLNTIFAAPTVVVSWTWLLLVFDVLWLRTNGKQMGLKLSLFFIKAISGCKRIFISDSMNPYSAVRNKVSYLNFVLPNSTCFKSNAEEFIYV